MMFKKLFFVIIILNARLVYGDPVDTTRLFYNISQDKLTYINKLKIDSLKATLKNVREIKVLGYSDYLGDKNSNYILSVKRAQKVKKYLSILFKNVPITVQGRGELDNDKLIQSTGGVPFNRRVEVIVTELKEPSDKTILLNDRHFDTSNSNRNKVEMIKKDSIGPDVSRIDNLSNLNIGESLDIPEIVFVPGKHLVTFKSKPYLEALLNQLKKHPTIKIEIQGHVCCRAILDAAIDGYDRDTEKWNLSANRAKFVYDYLLERGIEPNRMKYVGLGSSKPKVYPQLTPQDAGLNRRVGIVILEK